jgi:sec-independent protein translocase protein TatA
MGFPGGWELLVIALIVLLLFGGKKIPELMKGLGKGVKNFKDGMNGADDKKEENETLRNENKTLRNENEDENETLR